MNQIKACPLCNTKCEGYGISPLMRLFTINCPVCGKYNLTDMAIQVHRKRKDNFHIISGITRNFYELHKQTDGVFVIKGEMIDDDAKFRAHFLNRAPKNVREKALLLLRYIHSKSNYPNHEVVVNPREDYPICFCKNAEELTLYIDHLSNSGDIKALKTTETYSLSLTMEGWQKIERLDEPNIESKQAFVAMWFDDSMNNIFEKGICPLGDEKDKSYIGFKMLRIDQKPFNDKICDHIIAEIKQSRFMIADCTELRPAVFFEAGYAMGLGLPVIFTCKDGTDIKKCFDTDHYNHIVWKDADDLKNKLKDRILATIGKVHQ